MLGPCRAVALPPLLLLLAAGALLSADSKSSDTPALVLQLERLPAGPVNASAVRGPKIGHRPALGGGGGDASTQNICGVNSLVSSNSRRDCRILTSWPDGSVSTCTAFKVADATLATAGHCVFDNEVGMVASAISVYCKGANVCTGSSITARPSAAGTAAVLVGGYATASIQDAFLLDMAVIRTSSRLRGAAYAVGEWKGVSRHSVRVTGYPTGRADSGLGCDNSTLSRGACLQFTSLGQTVVSDRSTGMYKSTAMDGCAGMSGSALYDTTSKVVVGIYTAGSASGFPCSNEYMINVDPQNANPSTCAAPNGGASLRCLMGKLDA